MDNLTHAASYLRRIKTSAKKLQKPQTLHITFLPVSFQVQHSRAFLPPPFYELLTFKQGGD
jgi:hypothetical protein